nr:hypothetical protein [Tanacetum cinerariifolium]
MVGTAQQSYEPTTVEEKLDRKNEIKAKGTLLMALPNKDQLNFHSYQDAKLLIKAIEKRYFARECRAPKNQENRGREYGRKTMPVENPTKNALIAQDGIRGQVNDKVKTRLGYKAASPAEESFVNSYEMLDNQENVKSRSDKGYHAVPLAYTGICIPPKPDLMFIDEQVESEFVDVVSTISSSAVKIVKLKVESVDV